MCIFMVCLDGKVWVIKIQIPCLDNLQKIKDLNLTYHQFLSHKILEIHMTYLNIYGFRIKTFQIHHFKIQIQI